MITIQPEAKSQYLCARCGHSEDEHNWSTGPCNHKDGVTFEYPYYATHCTCYAFERREQ